MIELPTRLKPLFDDPNRNQIMIAHRRFAKTLYNVSKCVLGTKHHKGALTIKDGRFFIVLPTYKQAKLTAWDMLKDIAIKTGKEPKINETELLVRFDNGSTIRLVGSDNGDALRGTTMDGVCLDEWALHDHEVFTKIIIPALSDRNGWIVKTTTPNGMNHAYEDWEKSDKKHFYSADKTGVLPAHILEAAKKEMSEDEYNQEYLCMFLAYSGLVYNNFNESVHVVKPFEIPKEWTRLVGIDYGQTNPTAIPLIAIDYDGKCYIYDDEIYTSGQSVEDTSKILLNKLQGCRYYPYIDPSTMAQDQTRKLPDGSFQRYSIFQEFQNNGISGLMPGINQVLAGINKVKQLFAQDKLCIFSNCTNTIDEIKHYRWAQSKNKDTNAPERVVKVNDHACFVAGTKIKMADGLEKNIEDIKIGDNVETSDGVQRVVDCAMTGIKQVIEVRFSNGAILIGTPDHPIYTQRGNVAIDALRYDDIIEVWQGTGIQSNLRDNVIIGMENITPLLPVVQMGGFGYMSQYGSQSMALCQEDMLSITLTEIVKTIELKISNLFYDLNIARFMQEKTLKTRNIIKRLLQTWKRLDLLQRNGMQVRQAENGTINMGLMLTLNENQKLYCVKSAEKNTKQRSMRGSSVQTIAEANGGENPAKIILSNIALFVKNLLSKISIRNINAVRVYVVKHLEELQKVYNLTVENSHNYYANGILVSNCDAIRYAITSYFEATPKEKPKLQEYTLDWYEKMEEMQKKNRHKEYQFV